MLRGWSEDAVGLKWAARLLAARLESQKDILCIVHCEMQDLGTRAVYQRRDHTASCEQCGPILCFSVHLQPARPKKKDDLGLFLLTVQFVCVSRLLKRQICRAPVSVCIFMTSMLTAYLACTQP